MGKYLKNKIDKNGVCERFITRMRQAMEVSQHKYGNLEDAYPHKVNAIETLKDRLKKYEKTGNADYLVDVANFAMIEFVLPMNEKYHDKPTDGGEGRKWLAGGRLTEKRNDGERF
jgi:hypothetical protein